MHHTKEAQKLVRKVIKLGKGFAITLPKSFAGDTEYVLLLETGDQLLLRKAEVRERGGRLQDSRSPAHPSESPPARADSHE
jgi:hypothetical protein